MSSPEPNKECSTRLPLELHNEIINILRDDLEALRACASTCRAFSSVAQKLIFSCIIVIAGTNRKGGDYLTDAQFLDILENSPRIGSYVRSVKLARANAPEEMKTLIDKLYHGRDFKMGRTIFSCLTYLTELECLSIDYGSGWKTRVLTADDEKRLEQELACTLQLPTLHSLDMGHMTPGLLQYRKNLKFLCVDGATLEEPKWVPNPGMPRCSVKSLLVKLDGSNHQTIQKFRSQLNILCSSVIDITQLKRLFMVCCRHTPTQYHYVLADLLQACGQNLEFLVLDPNKDGETRELLLMHKSLTCLLTNFFFTNSVRDPYDATATLSLSNLTALKRLHIRVNTMYDDPISPHYLPWIINVLKTLPQGNSSRLVHLSFQINYDNYESQNDFLLCAELYHLAVDANRFPRLQLLEMTGCSYLSTAAGDKIYEDWQSNFGISNISTPTIRIKLLSKRRFISPFALGVVSADLLLIVDEADQELYPFWPNESFKQLISRQNDVWRPYY